MGRASRKGGGASGSQMRESTKEVGSLEIGEEIRLEDGSFIEIVNLQPTAYEGNPVAALAIWVEGEDLPFRVPVWEEVVTRPAPERKSPSRVVTTSPWGDEINTVEEMAPGVYRVDTPSHGGIMISREVGDKILSEEAKRVGAGFGYSPERPWSRDWYVFEEDDDWVAAASDLRAAFDMDIGGGLQKGYAKMPAKELKPGYIISDDETGDDAIVEDVAVLPDGRIELALMWGYGDQIGGGRQVVDSETEFSVERLRDPRREKAEDARMAREISDMDEIPPEISPEEEAALQRDQEAREAKRLAEEAEELCQESYGAKWDELSDEERGQAITRRMWILQEEEAARQERLADYRGY